ncbi:MAG: hypothetical protein J0M02_08850 [Planctomycetes bacterium]|nr:hypothetical protein [Planctomycetota bacterium]
MPIIPTPSRRGCSRMRQHLLVGGMLACALACAPVLVAGEETAAPPLAWSAQTLGANARDVAGALTISPPDQAWGATAVVARDATPFWTAAGTTVRMRITADASRSGGNLDGIASIGFITGDTAQRLQGADNFLGVNLAISKARNQCIITISRREKQGPEAIRGDKWGNPVAYDATRSITVPLSAGGFDLVLTATATTVTAAVPGQGEASFPHGLTAGSWKRAFLGVQGMHFNDGRMSLVVSHATVLQSALDSRLFRPLDLSAVANVGLADQIADDKQGGWTDQGVNDLRHVRSGRQTLRGIPFDILDQAANGGRSAVMLWSSGMDHLAKSVGPIAVGGTADSLIFLHAAAWAGKTGDVAARYRIVYADGSAAEVPVVIGEHIRDWWSNQEVTDANAAMLLQAKSEASMSGQVGIYAYRWVNPKPQAAIASVTLESAGGQVRTGVLAITAVSDAIDTTGKELLAGSFSHEMAMDPRRNPPDRDLIPDQVVVKAPKAIMPLGVSVSTPELGGGFGKRMLDLPTYPGLMQDFGNIGRFPHGGVIQFHFWPHRAEDWSQSVAAGGGRYGLIPGWFIKYNCAPAAITYQEMLETAKRNGQKLILLFNMHAMYDAQSRSFVYVKTLPEERMRKGDDALKEGVFSRENMARILANNATLVDYVIDKGYADTVAFWEMDNERWDMKGAEYAELVAAHTAMLRAKLPKARVIVCHGDSTYGGYSADPDKSWIAIWSRDMLVRLRELGMTDAIDYFAPHLYPFLMDKDGEITANFLGDWQVRNVYRSLDYFSRQLDDNGFAKSRLYATEWGSQSDPLGGMARTDLNITMAGALASAKTVMAVFSHPRIDGATWHPFLHQSAFGRASNQPVKQYGVQTVYMGEDGRVVLTPPAHAVRMFTAFMNAGGRLVPTQLQLPAGVQCLAASGADGRMRWFVVNGTASALTFPGAGIATRTTLTAPKLTDGAVTVFGRFGDGAGEFAEIAPVEAADAMLPPYSVNYLR